MRDLLAYGVTFWLIVTSVTFLIQTVRLNRLANLIFRLSRIIESLTGSTARMTVALSALVQSLPPPEESEPRNPPR